MTSIQLEGPGPSDQPQGLGASDPRNDLNGQLLQLPGQPEVYLIDHGYKRHIRTMEAFQSLFVPGARVVAFDITLFPRGSDVYWFPALVTGDANFTPTPVYLVDHNPEVEPYTAIYGRVIVDWDTLVRYQFDPNRIRRVPPAALSAMKNGRDVIGPPKKQ